MNRLEKERKPKIGFLFIACQRFRTLGEGSSGGNYVERLARETKAITEELSGELEIVSPGDIYDTNDLNRAIQAFAANKVDCILSLFHSWAEDRIWIRFLRESDSSIPLIYFYPAKESIAFEECGNENDFTEFLVSGGLVGSLVGSGSIKKMGRTAKVICGTIKQRKDDIIQYACLCKIRNILHQSRFGLMPAYNEVMWNTYIDPYRIFAYGPELTFVSYDELASISEKIPEKDINLLKEKLQNMYPSDAGVSEEKFMASVRYSIGLSKIMEHYDIDSLALNDVDFRLFEKIGLRPGFYSDEINESLSILCPEGDIGIAMAMYLLKLLTKKQVNIIEPFYIDTSRDLFCGGHAGPNDYNYPESRDYVKISIDARFAKSNYRYAGAPFAWLRIPPGEMTMVHISQIGNEIKLVAALVESLPGPHRINGYVHSEFRLHDRDINDFFSNIISIGTTQHFELVQGNYIEVMQDLASLCGFTFYRV